MPEALSVAAVPMAPLGNGLISSSGGVLTCSTPTPGSPATISAPAANTGSVSLYSGGGVWLGSTSGSAAIPTATASGGSVNTNGPAISLQPGSNFVGGPAAPAHGTDSSVLPLCQVTGLALTSSSGSATGTPPTASSGSSSSGGLAMPSNAGPGITPLVYHPSDGGQTTFHTGVWTGDDGGWQIVQVADGPAREADIQIAGGTPEQQLEARRAINGARMRLDAAIELLDKNWEEYMKANPDGVRLTPILRDKAERTYWLNKLREARSLFDGPNPIEVDISPRSRGRNGAGDSPAEVNCWELFGFRWWSDTITIKPPFFDRQSPSLQQEQVMTHELGRRVGIADGERGPHDDINLWDIITQAANEL